MIVIRRYIPAVMKGLIETMMFSMDEDLQMGFVIQTVILPMNVIRFGGRKDTIGRHEHMHLTLFIDLMFSFYRTNLK